jgi:hypothetical protein
MYFIYKYTQTCNLFKKKKVKIFSFISKDIRTQSHHAHVHEGES